MAQNETLRERIAYGLGASPDSPRVDYVLARVSDLLRNKICILTMSDSPLVRAAGESLAKELGLIENIIKPEASVL